MWRRLFAGVLIVIALHRMLVLANIMAKVGAEHMSMVPIDNTGSGIHIVTMLHDMAAGIRTNRRTNSRLTLNN
jgi:hypothetical protein